MRSQTRHTPSFFKMTEPTPLTGNAKRKASCKQIGGAKKRRGHYLEGIFNQQFGDPQCALTYKAEADCTLCDANIATKALLETLTKTIGWTAADPTHRSISLKSGSNLQFTLGNIPEITNATDKLAVMNSKALWNKYLKKSESAKPAGLLVYFDADAKSWIFFQMDQVIEFIVTKGIFRLLDTGRIKGDFESNGKSLQYLTYEYRETHGSHFLGANGGKGKPFIALLKASIPFVSAAITIPLEDK